MKSNLITLLLFLPASIFAVQAQNNQAVTKAEKTQTANYTELLTKLKGGDTKIDFKVLRMAYTETKEYSSYGMVSNNTDLMYYEFFVKKYKEAIKLADAKLEKIYIDLNAHYISSLANKAVGDISRADYHKEVFLGLINSILRGKDGKSAKTAYQVISLSEEDVVMRSLGYKNYQRSFANENNHNFDILTPTDQKKNAALTLYFNTDVFIRGYGKPFGK